MEVKMIKKQKIVEFVECPRCGYTAEIIGNWYNSLCPSCGKKE
jgi:rubrerythrin